MTDEQYLLGKKLVKTLRDVSPLDFFMQGYEDHFDFHGWWCQYGMYAYSAAEMGKLEQEVGCGTSRCVAGWLAALCEPDAMKDVMSRAQASTWVSGRIGIAFHDAMDLCFKGFAMTKEQKAIELEGMIEDAVQRDRNIY